MLHSYLIDPRAPLVFRNAKPFGETAVGETLEFPLPSTTAGALRTAYGEQAQIDYGPATRDLLMAIAVAGPLAARVAGDKVEALFPKPQDALYLGDPAALHRLTPGELEANEGSDLPAGLLPLLLDDPSLKGKPQRGPRFWSEAAMGEWLLGKVPSGPVAELGCDGPPVELRTHVAIDPGSFTSRQGMLFQSAGLDFSPRRRGKGREEPHDGKREHGWESEGYGLLVQCAEEIGPTWRRVGGEGRLARLGPAGHWPKPPEVLTQALQGTDRIRLILATPALFTPGWRPGWLDDQLEGSPPGSNGLRLKLKAAAIDRWQSVSGWDLVKNKPRAARRMVPAGSVYWFEVLERGDAFALWLHPISDGEQDRCDGFGLALPGIW